MPDVFKDGETDDRQAKPGEEVTPTRFRPRYRQLDDTEKKLHDDIKAKAEELEALYGQIIPTGRYHALAITSLEESVMWAVKELTK